MAAGAASVSTSLPGVRWMKIARGLVAAAHPLPSVAVTAFAIALSWSLWPALGGTGAGSRLLLGAAVLTGQLSVGWSNDAVDADRDRQAQRLDKPIPADLVSRQVVSAAAGLAAVTCAVLSFALGFLPGTLHVLAVASAWTYNLYLKRTWLSPAPYVISFALLAAVVATSAPGSPAPAPAVVLAAALLGAAAHFANTVGDTEADALTGVRGLPQRVGPQASLVVAAAGVATAALTLLFGRERITPVSVGLLGAGAAIAALSAVGGIAASHGTSRSAFRLCLVAVALVILGFVTGV